MVAVRDTVPTAIVPIWRGTMQEELPGTWIHHVYQAGRDLKLKPVFSAPELLYIGRAIIAAAAVEWDAGFEPQADAQDAPGGRGSGNSKADALDMGGLVDELVAAALEQAAQPQPKKAKAPKADGGSRSKEDLPSIPTLKLNFGMQVSLFSMRLQTSN